MTHRIPLATAGLLLVAFAACEGREPQPSATAPSVAQAGRAELAPPEGVRSGPYVRVLGIAQDGGVPQVGCSEERCAAARRDPGLAHRVASLAVVLPESGRVYLVDATPDLPAQLAALADVTADRPDRDPLDGVLLTHAHMGRQRGRAGGPLHSPQPLEPGSRPRLRGPRRPRSGRLPGARGRGRDRALRRTGYG